MELVSTAISTAESVFDLIDSYWHKSLIVQRVSRHTVSIKR